MAFGIGACYMVVAGDVSDVNNAVTVTVKVRVKRPAGLPLGHPRPHESMWRQMVEG